MNQALPCVFIISEKYTETKSINFESEIWPNIKSLFKLKQMSAGSLFFLINKIEYIAKNISQSEFTNHMLNIICKALDSNIVKLQKAVFSNLSIITKNLESHTFKNSIYLRMISILMQTQHQEVKLIILNSLKENYKLLDQTTINDSFLNTLEKLRKMDTNTVICLKIVDIYEEIAKVVSIEVGFLFF